MAIYRSTDVGFRCFLIILFSNDLLTSDRCIYALDFSGTAQSIGVKLQISSKILQ